MSTTVVVQRLLSVLGFQVDEAAVRRAENAFRRVTDRMRTAGMQAETLSSRINVLTRRFVTLYAAMRAGRFIVTTIAQFETIRARLETVTGSAEEAALAFETLKTFAAETPFELSGLTDAYSTLVSVGITPTQEELTALGNVAGASARPIEDLAVGIQRAVTGMPRVALRTFGFNVEDMGNRLAVTVQGVRHVIDDSSEAIYDFILQTGRTNFAGGMERQLNTLGGQWSNFVDIVGISLAQMGDEGLSQGLQDLINAFTEATEGAGSFIAVLGEKLGKALTFIAENLELIIFLFQAWGAHAVISRLIALVRSISLVRMSVMALNFAIMLIPGLLYLLIDDFVHFTRGHDSMIGRLIAGWKGKDGILGAIFDAFVSIQNNAEEFWDEMITPFRRFYDDVVNTVTELRRLFGLTTEAEEAEQAREQREYWQGRYLGRERLYDPIEDLGVMDMAEMGLMPEQFHRIFDDPVFRHERAMEQARVAQRAIEINEDPIEGPAFRARGGIDWWTARQRLEQAQRDIQAWSPLAGLARQQNLDRLAGAQEIVNNYNERMGRTGAPPPAFAPNPLPADAVRSRVKIENMNLSISGFAQTAQEIANQIAPQIAAELERNAGGE